MKSGVFPDQSAHAVSHLHYRRAPVSPTPARQPLRRSVALPLPPNSSFVTRHSAFPFFRSGSRTAREKKLPPQSRWPVPLQPRR